MAKRIPCSGCGDLRWPTKGSDTILCRECRKGLAQPEALHGTRKAYRERKCRCAACRSWATQKMAEYRKGRKARTGLAQARRSSRSYGSPELSLCTVCGLRVFGKVRSAAPMHNACRPERYFANMIPISRNDRLALYERDSWTCQICFKPVDRDLDVNDRMAATLDHIIPRATSLFPDDSPENLRLAHRSCNSRRGISAA